MITDFTTFAEIRGVLGVAVDELADATLQLPMYELALLADLEDIGVTLGADYDTVAAEAEPRTALRQALYDAVRLFAPYAVAIQLASSLPLFAPKTITDGKASVSRDSASPYLIAIANAKAQYERNRERLESKYSTFLGATVVATIRPFFSVAVPTVDPVTG